MMLKMMLDLKIQVFYHYDDADDDECDEYDVIQDDGDDNEEDDDDNEEDGGDNEEDGGDDFIPAGRRKCEGFPVSNIKIFSRFKFI